MGNPVPPRDDDVSEQKERSRSGGRPEYKPTDEQRVLVKQLAADKTPKTEIARTIGISRLTLRKHFAAELGVIVEPAQPGLALEGGHVPPPIEVGRPEYEPTERQRNDVRLWAADDWSEERMAQQLGISRNTLRKHFADDIQFGADRVRTKVLRDLDRASTAGKVGASNKLMAITDKVAPPPMPKAQPDEVPEPLGKKVQAVVDAKTAEVNTTWAELVRH